MNRYWFLSFLFCLTACAAPTPVVIHLTRYPTATQTALPPTATRTPRPTVRPTATLIPTETLAPIECPSPGNPGPIQATSDLTTTRAAILDYLDQGGTAADLQVLLNQNPPLTAQVNVVDLDNDALAEVLVTAHWGSTVAWEPIHAIWVFACAQKRYSVAQILRDGWTDPVEVVMIEDVNQDQHPEVFVHADNFGVSSCGLGLDVLGWQNRKLIDYFQLTGEWSEGTRFVCAHKLDLTLQERDNGWLDLVIAGYNGSGTIHDGPTRAMTQTFRFTADVGYQLETLEYAPPTIRVHALADAQRALDVQDFEKAIRFYEQAAYDETLENESPFDSIGGFYSALTDHPREYQSAFALFRLTAIWLKLGEADKFTGVLQELDATYPPKVIQLDEQTVPGGEFTVLAHVLQSEFAAGHTPAQACASVTTQIKTRYPDLERRIGYWGWANISYENDTLCPFH